MIVLSCVTQKFHVMLSISVMYREFLLRNRKKLSVSFEISWFYFRGCNDLEIDEQSATLVAH